MLRRRWARWGLILACWTLLGIFSGSRIYMMYAASGGEAHWWPSLSLGMADWYTWAAVAPAILWLARRYPFEGRHWARTLIVHLPAGVLLTAVKILMEHAVNQAIHFSPARRLSLIYFQPSFLTYLAILGIVLALDYHNKYREHQIRASLLEARLSQAQLQVLKMQLQPHFLFNTLHAVSTLMRRDVAAADKMLARLSDLLRLTLESGSRPLVRLKEELDLIRLYLEIQQVRFEDRLAVRIEVDPEALDALVPNMILQPLVENAVRHAIAPRPEGGRLEIRATVAGDRVRLVVGDDGPGLPAPDEERDRSPRLAGDGVGLANTRSRLEAIYGPAHRLDLSNGDGLEVTLEIPFAPEGARREDAGADPRPHRG